MVSFFMIHVCRFSTSFLGSRVVTGAALKHKLLEQTDAAGISVASQITQGPAAARL